MQNSNNISEVVLPGFRFHPTDEELVGYYLQRKVLRKSLPVDVITQLDIYKFDPWELPKFSVSAENVWYFFCLRDQKYRNSARPNRVTKGGFWKATGPDRTINSTDESKCIGLKKSLVFYKGRASKCNKTEWIMHEFRLPILLDPKRHTFQESWAVCRIFKKRNGVRKFTSNNLWLSPSVEKNDEESSSIVTEDDDKEEINAAAAAAMDSNFDETTLSSTTTDLFSCYIGTSSTWDLSALLASK